LKLQPLYIISPTYSNNKHILKGKAGINMAKAGMRRPNPHEPNGTESNKKMHKEKNEFGPVPEIQGKAKKGHVKASPVTEVDKS
jgi:hypothetical protein